ncbi:MAG: aminoacyl-tRNA hydrolase [Holosporaceae bacterium]|jgi:PTH1 family peptidyl-tRNA hydrolase|nr:aminoacyl-tRNA hydrolase [Holosporaceae bacterium]
MDLQWLFVGLGNPGQKYEANRHNVGFAVIDAIVESFSAAPFKKMTTLTEVSSFFLKENKIFLAKPLTFMNLSGQAVRFLMDFYKIPMEKIYVFHDDIDLELGRVKIKKGGGNGGHNGLRSIDSIIGNDYWRIRIGVGRPVEKSMVSSYVLSDFLCDEHITVRSIVHEISSNIQLLLLDCKQLESKLNTIIKT